MKADPMTLRRSDGKLGNGAVTYPYCLFEKREPSFALSLRSVFVLSLIVAFVLLSACIETIPREGIPDKVSVTVETGTDTCQGWNASQCGAMMKVKRLQSSVQRCIGFNGPRDDAVPSLPYTYDLSVDRGWKCVPKPGLVSYAVSGSASGSGGDWRDAEYAGFSQSGKIPVTIPKPDLGFESVSLRCGFLLTGVWSVDDVACLDMAKVILGTESIEVGGPGIIGISNWCSGRSFNQCGGFRQPRVAATRVLGKNSVTKDKKTGDGVIDVYYVVGASAISPKKDKECRAPSHLGMSYQFYCSGTAYYNTSRHCYNIYDPRLQYDFLSCSTQAAGSKLTFQGGTMYLKQPILHTELGNVLNAYYQSGGQGTAGMTQVPFFMIGQGPTFSDFERANERCNPFVETIVNVSLGPTTFDPTKLDMPEGTDICFKNEDEKKHLLTFSPQLPLLGPSGLSLSQKEQKCFSIPFGSYVVKDQNNDTMPLNIVQRGQDTQFLVGRRIVPEYGAVTQGKNVTFNLTDTNTHNLTVSFEGIAEKSFVLDRFGSRTAVMSLTQLGEHDIKDASTNQTAGLFVASPTSVFRFAGATVSPDYIARPYGDDICFTADRNISINIYRSAEGGLKDVELDKAITKNTVCCLEMPLPGQYFVNSSNTSATARFLVGSRKPTATIEIQKIGFEPAATTSGRNTRICWINPAAKDRDVRITGGGLDQTVTVFALDDDGCKVVLKKDGIYAGKFSPTDLGVMSTFVIRDKKTNYVKILAGGFDPLFLQISPGDSLCWVNEDTKAHRLLNEYSNPVDIPPGTAAGNPKCVPETPSYNKLYIMQHDELNITAMVASASAPAMFVSKFGLAPQSVVAHMNEDLLFINDLGEKARFTSPMAVYVTNDSITADSTTVITPIELTISNTDRKAHNISLVSWNGTEYTIEYLTVEARSSVIKTLGMFEYENESGRFVSAIPGSYTIKDDSIIPKSYVIEGETYTIPASATINILQIDADGPLAELEPGQTRRWQIPENTFTYFQLVEHTTNTTASVSVAPAEYEGGETPLFNETMDLPTQRVDGGISSDVLSKMREYANRGLVPAIIPNFRNITIDIKTSAFSPDPVNITAGSAITWKNADVIRHDLTIETETTGMACSVRNPSDAAAIDCKYNQTSDSCWAKLKSAATACDLFATTASCTVNSTLTFADVLACQYAGGCQFNVTNPRSSKLCQLKSTKSTSSSCVYYRYGCGGYRCSRSCGRYYYGCCYDSYTYSCERASGVPSAISCNLVCGYWYYGSCQSYYCQASPTTFTNYPSVTPLCNCTLPSYSCSMKTAYSDFAAAGAGTCTVSGSTCVLTDNKYIEDVAQKFCTANMTTNRTVETVTLMPGGKYQKTNVSGGTKFTVTDTLTAKTGKAFSIAEAANVSVGFAALGPGVAGAFQQTFVETSPGSDVCFFSGDGKSHTLSLPPDLPKTSLDIRPVGFTCMKFPASRDPWTVSIADPELGSAPGATLDVLSAFTDATVEVKSKVFDPDIAIARPGSTITFANKDNVSHTLARGGLQSDKIDASWINGTASSPSIRSTGNISVPPEITEDFCMSAQNIAYDFTLPNTTQRVKLIYSLNDNGIIYFNGNQLNPLYAKTRCYLLGWGDTVAADSLGRNNGTAMNGAAWTTGKVGGAMDFDGANDYVSVGSPASLNAIADNLTIEAWVYSRNPAPCTAPAYAGCYEYIVSNDRDCCGAYKGYSLFMQGGPANFQIWDTAGVQHRVATTGSVSLNEWHHIVGTFDGAGGGIARDSVGANNGTAVNGPASAAGKVGGAFQFDGVNDYVKRDTVNLPTGNVVTVEAWVYPKSYPTVTYNGIVSWGPRAGTGTSFLLSVQSNGRPSMATWGNDFVPATGPALTLNAWNHVAAVLNGKAVTLYVNGQSVSGNLSSVPNIRSGNLAIGSTDYPGRYFNGAIDEVAVYNRALSAAEIQQDYNEGVAGRGYLTTSGLVSYWKLDDKSEMKIYLDGQLNNNISFIGRIGTPASYPFYIGGMGVNPAAYNINGTIDEVAVYNRSLDASEIQQDYLNGLAGKGYPANRSGLVSYWKFDERKPSTVDLFSPPVSLQVSENYFKPGESNRINISLCNCTGTSGVRLSVMYDYVAETGLGLTMEQFVVPKGGMYTLPQLAQGDYAYIDMNLLKSVTLMVKDCNGSDIGIISDKIGNYEPPYRPGDACDTGNQSDCRLYNPYGPATIAILTTEMGLDMGNPSDLACAGEQLKYIKGTGSCPNCTTALYTGKINASALNNTLRILNGSGALDKLDLVARSVMLNKYPTCSIADILNEEINVSKTALYNYAKPSVLLEFGVKDGSNTARTCNWTNESIIESYNDFYGLWIPLLGGSGTIGVSQYCYGDPCYLNDYYGLVDRRSKDKPYTLAWLRDGCGRYYYYAEGLTPLTFSMVETNYSLCDPSRMLAVLQSAECLVGKKTLKSTS